MSKRNERPPWWMRWYWKRQTAEGRQQIVDQIAQGLVKRDGMTLVAARAKAEAMVYRDMEPGQ